VASVGESQLHSRYKVTSQSRSIPIAGQVLYWRILSTAIITQGSRSCFERSVIYINAFVIVESRAACVVCRVLMIFASTAPLSHIDTVQRSCIVTGSSPAFPVRCRGGAARAAADRWCCWSSAHKRSNFLTFNTEPRLATKLWPTAPFTMTSDRADPPPRESHHESVPRVLVAPCRCASF
jgi:hypothetical protein